MTSKVNESAELVGSNHLMTAANDNPPAASNDLNCSLSMPEESTVTLAREHRRNATRTPAAANDNLPRAANDNAPPPNIRQDMDERLWLPRWLVDWFTGQPILDGRSRRNMRDPVAYLAIDVGLALGCGAAVAATITAAPVWAPLVVPLAWLIQTGRLRKMQTLLGHESGHRNFFPRGDSRRKRSGSVFLDLNLNDLLGEIATTIALSPSVEDYRRDHDLHHDLVKYTTIEDPDTIEAISLTNWPWPLIDPAAYLRAFARRLRSNLGARSWGKRVLVWSWLGLLLSLAFVLPMAAWIAAVAVPLVILFRVSSGLQILSLHDWRMPAATSFQEYADRTWGRFSGIPLPLRGLNGLAWIRAWVAWWAEILLLELPFRIGVLTPDLQAHDVHHLEWILAVDMKALPRFVDDWRDQPFRRAEVIRDTSDALTMSQREIWGVRAMWRIARRNLARFRQAA